MSQVRKKRPVGLFFMGLLHEISVAKAGSQGGQEIGLAKIANEG